GHDAVARRAAHIAGGREPGAEKPPHRFVVVVATVEGEHAPAGSTPCADLTREVVENGGCVGARRRSGEDGNHEALPGRSGLNLGGGSKESLKRRQAPAGGGDPAQS